MTVLGIDTSSKWCGAALVRDGRVVVERSSDVPQSHAENLLSMVGECLEEGGCAMGKLDGVAVSSGPGSFTGLRVAFSTAKGICAATGCAFLPVPTFAAWAFRAAGLSKAPAGRVFLAVMAAGRGEVYAGGYGLEPGGIRTVAPARLFAAAQLPEFAAGLGGYTAVGEHADVILRALPGTDPDRMVTLFPGAGSPAAEVALLGRRDLLSGETGDIRTAEPVYIKEFSYKLPTQKGA